MNKVRITTKADQCLEVEQVGWTPKQIDILTSLIYYILGKWQLCHLLDSWNLNILASLDIFDKSKIKSDTFDISWTHFSDAISRQHHT